jgi:hypothetical protein
MSLRLVPLRNDSRHHQEFRRVFTSSVRRLPYGNQISPDPAAVVTVWSELPETIRTDIVAMGCFEPRGLRKGVGFESSRLGSANGPD